MKEARRNPINLALGGFTAGRAESHYTLKKQMKTPAINKRKEIVSILIILISFFIFYQYVFGNWEAIKQLLF